MCLFVYIREVIEKRCTAVNLLNLAVDLHKLELTPFFTAFHFFCSSALPLYISAPPSRPCPLLHTTTIRFILHKIFRLLYQPFKCEVYWGGWGNTGPNSITDVRKASPVEFQFLINHYRYFAIDILSSHFMLLGIHNY